MSLFFFFNDTATTEIYTLPLHDALPISSLLRVGCNVETAVWDAGYRGRSEALMTVVNPAGLDRKSTRLNSSHVRISYAVFCLKKKKNRHLALLAMNLGRLLVRALTCYIY